MNAKFVNTKFALRNYSGNPVAFYLTENVEIPISAVKPQPSHHIIVIDRSGSMYYDMAELRNTVEKVLTLDEFKNPDLKVSLISYSSMNDCTTHFSKVPVSDVMGTNSKYVAQIRGINATAMTCISQGLVKAETLIDDNDITCVSLHSDGYANDSSPWAEKTAVANAIEKLKKHPNCFVNTVSYRDSSDFQFLSSISNALSGTCAQARDIKQVYNALYHTMEGLAKGGSPTIEIPIGKGNFVVFVSTNDKKLLGSKESLQVRGVTADSGCIAYRFYEVDQKTWEDSANPVADNTDMSRYAFMRYALSDGRLNHAKFAMIDTRAANFIARNYKALASKDLAAFATDIESVLWRTGEVKTEYWTPGYGLHFGSSTTVLQVMDLIRRHKDSIRINLTDFRSKYVRRGLKRVAGVRKEDGTLIEPEFETVFRKADDYINPSNIEVNRTSATVNMTFAQPVDLVRKSNREVIAEVAGIPLNKLADFKSYTIVASGQLNVPSLIVKFSSKKPWEEAVKLGLVSGDYVPGQPEQISLEALPIVGDSLAGLLSGKVAQDILELTAQQKLYSAMLKGSSDSYSADQIEELKKYNLSAKLNINFPTTNAYTDLKEAIAKGEVDSNITYKVVLGTNRLLNAEKFDSGNAFLKANYTMTIDGKEVEKPTLDQVWKATVTPKVSKAKKPNVATDMMAKVFSDFFATFDPKVFTAEKAQESLDTVNALLDDLYAKVSPWVFYIASTGLFPDGVAVLDAEALQAKYPNLALAKAEKEGQFFELPEGGIMSVYSESNYYTVDRGHAAS